MTLDSQKSLTRREKEILLLLQSTIETTGCAPSYRSLMQLLGLSSPATVHKHIQNIKLKGYLEKSPDSRVVVANKLSPKTATVTVPIVGSIAKGKKLRFFQSVSQCELPSHLLTKNQNCYGFIAEDNSFSSEHIIQGDLLVIETRTSPKDNEYVLATDSSAGCELGRYVTREVCLIDTTTREPILYLDDPIRQIKGIITLIYRSLKS